MGRAEAVSHRAGLHRRGILLEWLTVAWNVIEAIVAVGAGVMSGSAALIGFGIDSVIEVTSAAALLWRLHQAGPEASAEKHGQAERRALFLVSGTFFLLAAYISVDASQALMTGEEPETSLIGVGLALLSLIVMPTLAYIKQNVGESLDSEALQADAAETWVCAYLSLALLVGLGLHALVGWWWADPVGALAMLPVILWKGWETFEEARTTTSE